MHELLQNDYEMEEMDEKEQFLSKKAQALESPRPRREGLKIFLLYI